MAAKIPNRLLYIDGGWKEPVLKNRIPIISPATEEIIGLSTFFSFFVNLIFI